jgi:hypothetical protein
MRPASTAYFLGLFTLSVFVEVAATPVAQAGENDIRFIAELSDDEQSIPTYSKGKGKAEIILERETLKITWTVTYNDLSSAPITAGLFGPENVGANAGMLIDFAGKGLNSPIKGSAILSDGQLQYLITGRIYVNITSQKWKDGELRGQLKRQPPT